MNGKGCAGLVLALLLSQSAARGEDFARRGLASGECAVPADAGWTSQEKFVWQNVCSGKTADFNEGADYGGELDPTQPEGLPETRILRWAFIETILLGVKYRHAVNRRGVTIIGARFTSRIDLSGADLQYDLGLIGCLMEKGGDFKWLKSTRSLVLNASKVIGLLDMEGLDVQQNLSMRHTELDGVELAASQIGGQLLLIGATVGRRLNMTSIRIHRDLLMGDAALNEILLRYARVDGQISFGGSKVNGPVDMDALHVDHDLLMYLADVRDKVELNEGYIGGQFSLSGSTFHGPLMMTSLHVGSNLFVQPGGVARDEGAGVEQMREAVFKKPISLYFGKIEGSLELIGSFHGRVDLTGTQISGDLGLARAELRPDGGESTEEAHWSKDAALILRNVKAGALQDLPDAWPNTVDLNGFAYNRLGGIFDSATQPVIKRPVGKFEAWLGGQASYSPGPYEQLAKVLRNQGCPDAADDIMVAAKERERTEATGSAYIGLTLSKWFIGYGYSLFQSLIWISVFLVLGTLALAISKQGGRISRHYNLAYGFFYSFDLLLPIIKLREKHYNVDLNGWVRYYFYFHKIMGYVLGGFVIAGLSGLAK